jgi:hypothetical protein
LNPFELLGFHQAEMMDREFGVIERVLVTGHFPGVVAHEPSCFVHLPPDHSVLLTSRMAKDPAIGRARSDAETRLRNVVDGVEEVLDLCSTYVSDLQQASTSHWKDHYME